jgi:hypothetical protein
LKLRLSIMVSLGEEWVDGKTEGGIDIDQVGSNTFSRVLYLSWLMC